MEILERPLAALYSKIIQSTETKSLRRAHQNMLKEITDKILEIGVGNRANFTHHSPKASVTTIEPSKHFYKRAKSKLATT